jgi:hypothetical protein
VEGAEASRGGTPQGTHVRFVFLHLTADDPMQAEHKPFASFRSRFGCYVGPKWKEQKLLEAERRKVCAGVLLWAIALHCCFGCPLVLMFAFLF